MTRLDEALPEYDFRERHARYVAAPPDHVDEAVRAVTIGDMPLAQVLFEVRAMPARLIGRSARPRPMNVPLLGHALSVGFGLLGDVRGQEIVVGMIGQPWKRVGGESHRFELPEEFVAFSEPGFSRPR